MDSDRASLVAEQLRASIAAVVGLSPDDIDDVAMVFTVRGEVIGTVNTLWSPEAFCALLAAGITQILTADPVQLVNPGSN